MTLCRRHHRLLHEGGYSMRREADGSLGFRHRGGWEIRYAPPLVQKGKPPPLGARELYERNVRQGLSIDAGTAWTGWGERMDLDLCMYAVCRAKDRAAEREEAAAKERSAENRDVAAKQPSAAEPP